MQMRLMLSLFAASLAAQESAAFYALEKERALGTQMASEVRRQSSPIADPEINAYVQRVGAELAAGLAEGSPAYRFEAISHESFTEPFFLPGGYVFVPVRALAGAEEEAEFVCMLAHAVGHAASKHGFVRGAGRPGVNVASIPLLYFPTHSDLRSSPVLTPLGLFPAQRAQELEADRVGLELAAKAGYDPAAFRRYIERAQTDSSRPSPLPARDVRLAALDQVIALLARPARSSAGEEFLRVRESVRTAMQLSKERRPAPTLRR